MKHKSIEEFAMLVSNASNNRLINIALDESQKVENNEDDDVRFGILADEMEKRGLDVGCIKSVGDDHDFDIEG